MPLEYAELLLCERFGWSLEDLDNADAETVFNFLDMWSVEAQVSAAKNPPKKGA
jgi:hypothetical protein